MNCYYSRCGRDAYECRQGFRCGCN